MTILKAYLDMVAVYHEVPQFHYHEVAMKGEVSLKLITQYSRLSI